MIGTTWEREGKSTSSAGVADCARINIKAMEWFMRSELAPRGRPIEWITGRQGKKVKRKKKE